MTPKQLTINLDAAIPAPEPATGVDGGAPPAALTSADEPSSSYCPTQEPTVTIYGASESDPGDVVGPTNATGRELPPVLVGMESAQLKERTQQFYLSVAEIFERWVARRNSPHTQRAYRQDIHSFIQFMGIEWPAQASLFFTVTVADVQAWRDELLAQGAAPKTLNRRVSSLAGFYKYLQGIATEIRLPITVPNPAHAQFIARESTDPRDETRALTINRARQLMALPAGESLVAYRDRAMLKFFLYTGARLSTGCSLRAQDFHCEENEATIRFKEKGSRKRTIGLNFAAAEAIAEYLQRAGITAGPVFRPQSSPKSKTLANRHMTPTNMYLIIMSYLQQLPGAMKDHELADGTIEKRCIYSPHSLRATTATLLLDSGIDIRKVQHLLGHRHVTTTQIYDKRRISASQSASHEVPI